MAAMAVALILAAAAATAAADFAGDRAECTEQLTGLLPCLGFVEGAARMPTPDCCVDTKSVVEKSFKCLCVLVKDRNEPGLGLKINVTRAVTLPGFCHVPANVSNCPKLLNLPAGSPAAREFYELEKEIVRNAEAGPPEAAGSPTTGCPGSSAQPVAGEPAITDRHAGKKSAFDDTPLDLE
ncbi:hypothetical protein KSP40_PGU017330 [Platanthera guangdongensis]|uniref:Bifunctional inhibitor/plant lipid transfer protein/seed storage helical domain-containing protein n=1 Tax=Platanthera guangdongensis TaxID=2320717 RepID=A0ABR2LDA5_9ASPA